MAIYQEEFRSQLRVAPAEVWAWIVSFEGILREMRPWLRMSAPRGVRDLRDVKFEPGKPLFRSRLYLGGFLPIGHSDLTLWEMTEEQLGDPIRATRRNDGLEVVFCQADSE